MSDLKYCIDCRDDFYNGKNDISVPECWKFRKAQVVTRWKLAWWTNPDEPGAFTEVVTHDCHRETGRFAFEKELPLFAVNPVRIEAGREFEETIK